MKIGIREGSTPTIKRSNKKNYNSLQDLPNLGFGSFWSVKLMKKSLVSWFVARLIGPVGYIME